METSGCLALEIYFRAINCFFKWLTGFCYTDML